MALIDFSGSFPKTVKDEVIALLDKNHKYKCKDYNKRSCDISGYTSITNFAKILLYYMYATTSYMTCLEHNLTQNEQEELYLIRNIKSFMQYNDNPQYVYTSFMSNTDKEKEIIKLTKTKEYLNTNIAPLYKDNPSYIQNLNNQIQNYINYLQK